MGEPAREPPLSAARYLEIERRAEAKSEFFAGEAFAMAGASRLHNYVVGDFFAALLSNLHGSGCDVFMSDMRVRVDACDAYFYPDITVACGEARFEDDELDTLLDPTLIVEVLSPSTEAFDRGEKARCYRQLPSLRQLAIVSPSAPQIDLFERADDGLWTLQDISGLDESSLQVAIANVEIDLVDVYRRAIALWSTA